MKSFFTYFGYLILDQNVDKYEIFLVEQMFHLMKRNFPIVGFG